MLGLVCVPCVENLRDMVERGDVGERRCCAWNAIPLDESDSHVKVNWVLVGVVAAVCWSSKLTFPGPLGGDGTAAAFAMAAEMMPWSVFPAKSPKDTRCVSYTASKMKRTKG